MKLCLTYFVSFLRERWLYKVVDMSLFSRGTGCPKQDTGVLIKSLASPGRKQTSEECQGSARFQQHRDSISHQVFFFLLGKALKEIHVIPSEILVCFLPGRAKNYSVPL